MTEAELAYIAGIVDGEGAICVRFRSGLNLVGSGRYLHFRVDIAQKDRRLIDWLEERIGGNISLRPTAGVYHLNLGKRASVDLLQRIRPYLVVKGEQADAFLELAARDYVHGRRISEIELVQREQLVDALSAMKGRSG